MYYNHTSGSMSLQVSSGALWFWCVVMGVLVSVRYSQTQLTPSGDVLVCPHSTVEITCNVTGNVNHQWRVMSSSLVERVSYPIFQDTMVGTLLTSPRTPGITVMVHVVSSTGISSSLTVNTANYSLPITVECDKTGEVVGTASIGLLSMLNYYGCMHYNHTYVRT